MCQGSWLNQRQCNILKLTADFMRMDITCGGIDNAAHTMFLFSISFSKDTHSASPAQENALDEGDPEDKCCPGAHAEHTYIQRHDLSRLIHHPEEDNMTMFIGVLHCDRGTSLLVTKTAQSDKHFVPLCVQNHSLPAAVSTCRGRSWPPHSC